MRFILRGAGVYAAILALLLIFEGEGLQRVMLEMVTAAPYALAIIVIAIYVAVLCAMQSVGLDRRPKETEKHEEKAPVRRRSDVKTRKTMQKNTKSASKTRGKRREL